MPKSKAVAALSRAMLAVQAAKMACTSATARAYCDDAAEELQRALSAQEAKEGAT